MTDGGLLQRLGWTDEQAAAFQPLGVQGLVPGRVSLEHNHVYRVLTEDGERLAESSGRVKFRAERREALPAVGDWVALKLDTEGRHAQIRHVLPRRTWFSRRAAGRETEEQVVAANVDTVWLVFGLDLGVNLRAIERYLLVARTGGARSVVVLNKADIVPDVEAVVAEAAAAGEDATVVAVSARTGRGLDRLERDLAPGRTIALLGPSGAGKSSIVNRLLGTETLPTGDVRAWDSRGRHTSVHRQLLLRDRGGVIIDTPGMRELQLWSDDAVADAFADIRDLAASCRFRDCRHEREPGCAVKEGVDHGLVTPDRYQGFLKLQAEQADAVRRREERDQLEAKRRERIAARAARTPDKDRDRR